MESRVLGAINLIGGPGGAIFETSAEIGGSTLPFRLELDYPGRFDERQLEQLDDILLGWERIDAMAEESLTTAMENPESAPAQLFQLWEDEDPQRAGKTSQFLAELQPLSVTVLWDIDGIHKDRIVMPYSYSPLAEKVTLRFKDRIGVEIDPAPRGGYQPLR